MGNIGERIKNRRLELGYSQDDLAKKLGYKSRSSINKIEMGDNSVPQNKIIELAKALKCSPLYLLDSDDSRGQDMVEVKSPDSDRYEYPDSFTVNSSDVLLVSREEQEIIKKLRRLPQDKRKTIENLLNMLSDDN